MQSARQYGVNEVQQFVVGGSSQQHPPPSPHIFSHDLSVSPSDTGHAHPGRRSQQQHQALYASRHHTTHQPQASSHSSQQQRQHQEQQHAQQQEQHHMQQHQNHVVQPQLQQTVQHLEHSMVHQLGLGGGLDSPEPVPSPVASRPSPTGFANQMSATVSGRDLQALGHETLGNDVDDGMEGEEGRSTGGNRWPRQETLLLIKIRSEMDSNFRDSGLKGPLWEDVARKLSELGYNRSAKKCKEKFENIHKYYKKTKDGKAGRQDGKNYRFFSELDALYSGRNASTQADAAAALTLPGSGHGSMVDAAVTAPSAFRAAVNGPPAGFAVSDSSEDNRDDHRRVSDDDTRSKKRKRKDISGPTAGTSSKVMLLESLVKKLIDKQEAMQRKFLESMERREQERIAREEAWKTQERDRMICEHELRTREHNLAVSRDAALVAVLQKVTGQTLQLPQMPPPPPPPPESYLPQVHTIPIEAHIQNQHDHRPQQQQHELQDEPDKDGSTFDPHSKRWPTPEVHALIRLRIEMESKFQDTGAKGPLWEEISKGMSSMGYSRNAKRCKEKWENVNKYYKKTKESNKKRPENSKTCPYFPQLEALYRSGGLGTYNKLPSKVDHQQTDGGPVPDHLLQDHRDDDDDDDDSAGFVGGDASAVNMEIQRPAAAVNGPGAPVAAAAGSASNGAAAHSFSNPHNGSSGDLGLGGSAKKGITSR